MLGVDCHARHRRGASVSSADGERR